MTDTSDLSALSQEAREKYERQRQEYAALCALDIPGHRRDAYLEKFMCDFDRLCGMPCFPVVAVNLAGNQLILGTRIAKLRRYDEGPLREIGEFIICISKRPSGFTFQNVTRQINGFHHPHIQISGTMCIGEKAELNAKITDGDLADVASRLWIALNTSNGSAYSNPDDWPLAADQTENQR